MASFFYLKSEKIKSPYISTKSFQKEFNYKTRLADSGAIRFDYKVTNDTSKENFSYKFSKYWNMLPLELKQSETVSNFKSGLKQWIKENISIK